ncbi:NFACT family protein [Mycoplasmatota bacterium]|nr:NFACT family protein [Mycoplasmatota bacterium]
MNIDGLFIKQLIVELESSLDHARLEKIQQINQGSFLFRFYRRGKKHKLLIHLFAHDYRMFITQNDVVANETSQFLVSLKKHIEGAILTSISQYLSDRVVIFEFMVNDFIFGQQTFKLIFEAMGKHANLLLVKDKKIIDTYKKMFFDEGRQLLPQADFEFFPSDKKSFDDIDYHLIETPKQLQSTYMGISSKLATYLFHFKKQINEIEMNPTYDLDTNMFYICDIFDDKHEKQYFNDLSSMMDAYHTKKVISKTSYDQFINKQLKKYRIKDIHLKTQLNEAKEQLNIKDSADLIYMSGMNLNQKSHEISVFNQTIKLDEHLTLNENAQKLYKKYHKAKRSIDPILQQIEENENLIQLFEEFQTYLDLSSAIDLADFEQSLIPYGYTSKKQTQKQQKHKQKPHVLEIIDEDATYYIGKNSMQNSYITHDLAQQNDYWFHVKGAPGSHLIVKSSALTEKIIRKAAMLAAYHSKLRLSSSIPVDYTQIKHIKKIPHKPGYQVFYHVYKTIFIDIDELLIKSYLT